MDITLRVAYCTLGVMYLAAGAIRLAAAMQLQWLRREYLMSVAICVALSLRSFSVLWTGVVSSGWSLFGLLASGAAVIVVYVKPAVKAMRFRALPTKAGDGR